MAVLLALTAAAAYGVGDFLGGIAARRAPSTTIVFWSHIVGLASLVVAAPLVGGDPSPRGMAAGAAAGLIGALGVTLFYMAFARGSMSVIAPITALLSAAVPVLAGVGFGERPSGGAVVGILVALVAVALVSRERSAVRTAPWQRVPALGLALAAGAAFGLFFVALERAGTDTGIWPLAAARVASVSLFALLGAARVTTVSPPPRNALGAAVGAGLLDTAANVFYVLALAHGLLSIVAALTALYPAGTVILARYVLGERLSRVQQAGLGMAAMAAVLIA